MDNNKIKKEIKNDTFPKVSFVIPTYNCDRDLDLCLESIFSQDYPLIEVIILDEGSTDNIINKILDILDMLNLSSFSLFINDNLFDCKEINIAKIAPSKNISPTCSSLKW